MTITLQQIQQSVFPGPEALRERAAPTVFRAEAAAWPAVLKWSFANLAAAMPPVPVALVDGERESGATRFKSAALRSYVASLGEQVPQQRPRYLKEFDLLRAAPALRADLLHTTLLPRRCLSSLRSWIGPAGAATGLHHDYLDNVAVQVIGRKRWRLARPGTVERLGAVAPKYDAWAVLASCSVEALSQRGASPDDLFEVETGPGDVLHVPAGWWHEVLNLTPALLFGGFHGPALPVLGRWAWVGVRNARHRWGRLGRGDCTCHATTGG